MSCFNLTYIKPILEVEKMLPAHISYLEENYNTKKFICSGRKNPRIGGIILCNCATKQEAEQIMEQDPFFREKIARYEIIEFVPSKSLEEFKVLMEKIK
ncbi:YciI family protein [Lachnospiraceae bacterium JLR.KK009]